MELTFIEQSEAFAWSLLLGAALGILYGPFKIFRLGFCSSKISIIFCDIIFMVISALAVFFFSIAFLYGYIRFYVFIGCGLGFLLYRSTGGKLFSKLYCPIIAFIKKLSRNIQAKFKKITKKLLKIAYKILYNIITKIRIFGNKRVIAYNKRVMASDEKKSNKRKGQNENSNRKQ